VSRSADEAVAIVAGGSHAVGREVVRALASRGFAIVVVYLDDQGAAEATVEEVLADGGAAVAVRANLTDDLDVERLFRESVAAFGGIDVVAYTEPGTSSLHAQALRHLRG
jgi:3-oxoacyl-[acyl-carrier protein] reductase